MVSLPFWISEKNTANEYSFAQGVFPDVGDNIGELPDPRTAADEAHVDSVEKARKSLASTVVRPGPMRAAGKERDVLLRTEHRSTALSASELSVSLVDCGREGWVLINQLEYGRCGRSEQTKGYKVSCPWPKEFAGPG